MNLLDIDSKTVLMKLTSDFELNDNFFHMSTNSNAQVKKFTMEQAIIFVTWKEQGSLLVISLSFGQ